MTLTRQFHKIIFVCDQCHDALETGITEFDDAIAELRDEGWRSIAPAPGHLGWKHLCPDCQGGEFEAA